MEEIRSKNQATRLITGRDQNCRLKVQRAQIKVIKGPDKGKLMEVPPDGITVGGDIPCNFVLSDPAISRQHFELLPCEKGFRLTDLDSTNGTRVNGFQTELGYLRGDEIIQIGKTTLKFTVFNAHEEVLLSSKNQFGEALGRSIAMRRLFAILERVAPSDTSILLEGESGTGKDLIAQTVHRCSPRNEGPFIVVDCGTMQPSLIESELFGHRKGAFTGAERDRAGAFESADSGTVFLDEIGEVAPVLQPKLLRLLENKEIRRIGENHYRNVDVRVIAATNRDLSTEVALGHFREDLYFRLSVMRVRVPPLRQRRDDIALLARSFIQKLKPESDPSEVLSVEVLNLLLQHNWPGNVRELRNVVERLLLFPELPHQAVASKESPCEENWVRLPFHTARNRWNDKFEKMYIANVLDVCNGIISQAARTASIPRQTFYRLMNKHGLGRA